MADFKNWKYKAIILMTVTFSLLLTGCTAKNDEIVIASLNPMTGSSSQFGQMKVKGMKIAVDKINSEGGIRGKHIVLKEYDDEGSPKVALNLAKSIIEEKEVIAVNAHWNSGCMLATRGVFQSAGLPVITDCAGKDVTDGATPVVFRISRSDKVQAKAIAEYASKTMNIKKAAVISIGNDFGQSYSKAFIDEFSVSGGTVVANEVYYEGMSKNFMEILKRIKKTKPEMLMIVSYYDDTALIANYVSKVGMKVELFGADGVNDAILSGLCNACVEDLKFIGFGHPSIENKGTKEFVEKFRAEYNMEPDSYAMMGYDSIMLIANAVKEKGFSRKDIINYLSTENDFEGVTGKTVFENNEATRDVVILKVKGGKVVPVK